MALKPRFCRICKRVLPSSKFYVRRVKGKNYRRSQCKECDKKIAKEWKDKNPQKVKQQYQAWKKKEPEGKRTDYLMRSFGLTYEDYQKLLINQGSVCAVCEEPPKKRRLAVDHDHRTGEIRGLLCWRCNHLLGVLERRQPEDLVYITAALIRYVDGPPARKVLNARV